MFTKQDTSLNQKLEIISQSNERCYVILTDYHPSLIRLEKPGFFDNIGEVLSGSDIRWKHSFKVSEEEYFLEILSKNMHYEMTKLTLADDIKVTIDNNNHLSTHEARHKLSYFESKNRRCYAEFNMSLENMRKGCDYVTPKWHGVAILDPNRADIFKGILKHYLIAIHIDVLNSETNEWQRVISRQQQQIITQNCTNPCLLS